MYARKGDRLIVPGPRGDRPVRGAEVLAVRNADGSPPYHVRWSDTGGESFLLPGPDAYVEESDLDELPADVEGSR